MARRRHRQRHREADKRTQRYDARRFVRLALKAGLLVRGPCACRGADGPCDGAIEAHHHRGYAPTDWLNVVWVCRRHHRLADRAQADVSPLSPFLSA